VKKLIATLMLAASVTARVGNAPATAQSSLMPNSYKRAADTVFRQENQRRADQEARNRAYVPPPPAPNSTRLPRDNMLKFDWVTPGYPLPMTSGNGCGGIGVVAIAEAERLAAETLGNTRPADPLMMFRDLLQRMVSLYGKYMEARYITPSALAYDPRDLFVPDFKKLGAEKIRECVPTVAKVIDNYREQQQKLKEAQAEAARQAALPHNRVINAYSLYAKVTFCNEVREGYLLQYVNDSEFVRAKAATKAIVAAALKEDSSLDTDDLWNKGRSAINGFIASQGYCQLALSQLLNASPVNPYEIRKP
jgi:hypothetical protein